MKKIEPRELIPNAEYLKIRDAFVREIIAHKKRRRVELGPFVTLVFEDRKTMLFQIQEMIRTEGITKADAIAHEVSTYNELLPDEDELSATLLIGVPDRSKVREELDQLVGLDEHCGLQVGDLPRVRATFDPGQYDGERISAVQFIKLPLTPEHRAAFCDPAIPAELVVDHPHYSYSVTLDGNVRESLMEELQRS